MCEFILLLFHLLSPSLPRFRFIYYFHGRLKKYTYQHSIDTEDAQMQKASTMIHKFLKLLYQHKDHVALESNYIMCSNNHITQCITQLCSWILIVLTHLHETCYSFCTNTQRPLAKTNGLNSGRVSSKVIFFIFTSTVSHMNGSCVYLS